MGSAYFVTFIELQISTIQSEISPNRQYLEIICNGFVDISNSIVDISNSIVDIYNSAYLEICPIEL